MDVFESVRVSAVIPTINEEKTIGDVIRGLKKIPGIEIIVVDTNSTDKTREISSSLGATVIEEPRRGYGRAYLTGLSRATGDVIVCMDGDGTYPVDVVPALIDLLIKEDVDFISCDRMTLRTEHNYTRLHFIGNSILNIAIRILFGVSVKDSQSGMWIFKSSLLRKIHGLSEGMSFSEEIKVEAAKHGLIIEVPIRYGVRVTKPKLNTWKDGFSNLFRLFIKRVNP